MVEDCPGCITVANTFLQFDSCQPNLQPRASSAPARVAGAQRKVPGNDSTLMMLRRYHQLYYNDDGVGELCDGIGSAHSVSSSGRDVSIDNDIFGKLGTLPTSQLGMFSNPTIDMLSSPQSVAASVEECSGEPSIAKSTPEPLFVKSPQGLPNCAAVTELSLQGVQHFPRLQQVLGSDPHMHRDVQEGDWPKHITTLMLSNIPERYRHLLCELEKIGLKKTCDFLYMPIASSDAKATGHAFLNFLDASCAARAFNVLNRHVFLLANSDSAWPARASIARVQGLAANVELQARNEAKWTRSRKQAMKRAGGGKLIG